MVHSVNMFELLRNFKSKDEKRCILTLFETMFWNLELLRIFFKSEKEKNAFHLSTFENEVAKLCILTLFETIFWNF